MYPFALVGLVVACYFLYAAWQRPRPAVIVAATLWVAYSAYEYLVANGTICDANCNIRVDLILAWPLLGIASLFASNTPGQRSIVKKVLGAIALFILVLIVAPLAYIALVGFSADTPSDRSSQPSPK